jgi:hypothetical protein
MVTMATPPPGTRPKIPLQAKTTATSQPAAAVLESMRLVRATGQGPLLVPNVSQVGPQALSVPR